MQLQPYVVLYRVPSLGLLEAPLVFLCRADDGDHAEEQCIASEPDVTVVWVYPGDDIQQAYMEYWGWV